MPKLNPKAIDRKNMGVTLLHTAKLTQIDPPKRRFGKAEPSFTNAFPGEALFNGVSTLFGLRFACASARACVVDV